MDVPEERRAWQISQSNYQEPPDGKKQDYTSIIAKAMIGYYDKKEETHLTIMYIEQICSVAKKYTIW